MAKIRNGNFILVFRGLLGFIPFFPRELFACPPDELSATKIACNLKFAFPFDTSILTLKTVAVTPVLIDRFCLNCLRLS
jgi:hypothetical protein